MTSLTNIENNIKHGETSKNISQLCNKGIEINDEGPAPVNVSETPATKTGRWEKPRTCPRHGDVNITYVRGAWKGNTWPTIALMDEMSIFQILTGEPLQLSEFYKWLRCRIFMACFIGLSDYRKWWSSKPIDLFEGALFRLNSYMSLIHFKSIDGAIHYTDKLCPEFQDKLYDVCQLIDGFNQHMADNFFLAWLNCFDESLNTWLNKYCPVFMVVVRKAHPFGNEYHSVADGDEDFRKPIM
ncbi:hypothetical protein ACHAW6_016098 [Cyclotella cf. meneghiniana]